jgi:3'(2'), 5'-bisphosphate nucleotidase
MIDLDKIPARLTSIAEEAGEAILEVYEQYEDVQVEKKSDDSPLTLADKRSNEVICQYLQEEYPDIPIISEENREVAYELRKAYSWFWLVDPLDGTKEFIKRNGEFTVNIALVHHGQPVFGVVHAPCLQETYYGGEGIGAFRIKEGKKEALKPATFSMEDPGLNAVCSRSHLNEATQAFLDKMNDPSKVSKGSSLKFLMLATGEAHVYPRLAPTMEWDTGAAQAVLEAAGGTVVDYDSCLPLRYNKENLLNPYFVAYGPIRKDSPSK